MRQTLPSQRVTNLHSCVNSSTQLCANFRHTSQRKRGRQVAKLTPSIGRSDPVLRSQVPSDGPFGPFGRPPSLAGGAGRPRSTITTEATALARTPIGRCGKGQMASPTEPRPSPTTVAQVTPSRNWHTTQRPTAVCVFPTGRIAEPIHARSMAHRPPGSRSATGTPREGQLPLTSPPR